MSILYRLQHIKWEIKDLINEANELFADTPIRNRFKKYPYAHIITALDKDHEFLAGSFITFQDCLDELEQGEIE